MLLNLIGGRYGIIRKRGYGSINANDELRNAEEIGGKKKFKII